MIITIIFGVAPLYTVPTAPSVSLAFSNVRYLFIEQLCCNAEPSGETIVGLVTVAPLPTGTTAPVYTEDSPLLSIDASTGLLSVDAGQTITAPTIFTVTATSLTTGDTVTAETIVELRPKNGEYRQGRR